MREAGEATAAQLATATGAGASLCGGMHWQRSVCDFFADMGMDGRAGESGCGLRALRPSRRGGRASAGASVVDLPDLAAEEIEKSTWSALY